MRIRRLAATGAVLALSFGVVACDGGGEEPTAAPSTTAEETTDAATTEPAETSEAAPDVPKPDPADYPGKDEQTEEGAKQATRYYWAMVNWGYMTGESRELKELFAEGCENCEANLSDIEEISRSGTYWLGVEISDEEFAVGESEEYDKVVEYNFVLGAHEVVDESSGNPSAAPSAKISSANALNWTGNGWEIDGITVESEESP